MQEVTKSLLYEYHAGRATPLQVRLIEDWLKDQRNESLFYQTLFEWETAHPQYIANMSAALEQYRRYMDGTIVPAAPISTASGPRLGNRFFSAWLVAASVIFLLTLTVWLLREPIWYKTYTTRFGEIEPVELPDGTRVTLNANSTLRVPRFTFGRHEREVSLTGEAEFSVAHTADHQRFIVKTDRGVNVEVLGTEFVVFARERATQVVLTKGKVKLHYKQPDRSQGQLTMSPGERATFSNKGQLSVKKTPQPTDFIAWKEHKFVFNNTPLREIGYMIKETYGLDVEIKGQELAERKVNGDFEATNADELLRALKEMLSINVTRQSKRVIFSEQKQ